MIFVIENSTDSLFLRLAIQLAIGRTYTDQCPISSRIPRYLVIAGIVGLILAGLQIFQALFSFLATKRAAKQEIGQAFGFIAPVACSFCVTFFLLIFLFIWFILGCIWVFGVWGAVQYRQPNLTTYCHPTLYRFAFALLLISLIVKILNCVFSSARGRKTVTQLKQ